MSDRSTTKFNERSRKSAETSLVLHPERRRVGEALLEKRRTLSELLAVRFRLCYEDLPAAQYRYSTLFGELERNIQEQSLKMAERRRLAELLAIKIERGQPIDQETIELTMSVVRNEFGEVRKRLNRDVKFDSRSESFVRKNERSRGSRQNTRSTVQRLFRQLAKQLHPDRTSDNDPLFEQFWNLTLSAYARGDVESLRSIANSLSAGNNRPESDTPTDQAQYLNHLDDLIRKENERISELTSTEPLSLREQMEDEEWIRDMRESLQEELREVNASVEKYQEMLEPILRETVEPDLKELVVSWSDYIDEMYLSGRH